MKTIIHWTIQITWSDDKKEYLDNIPYFKNVENYLDKLEEVEND